MNRVIAALRPDLAEMTDHALLGRFAADRDGAAFAELVRRHGPAVWGVCRAGLTNAADAEDAFQATFLVLVRRADRAADHPALGPWLRRVAALTVRNCRRANRRRAVRTEPLPGDVPASDPAPTADARQDVAAAVARLPARLRVPVQLCHLQGLSRAEAAARLGCPEGTLSAALAAAVRRLRAAFGRPGVAAVPAVAVPAAVAAAASRAAVAFASSSGPAGISPAAVHIARGVLHMLWVKKFAAAAAVVAVAVGLTVRAGGTADDPPAKADDLVEVLRTRLRLDQFDIEKEKLALAEKERRVAVLKSQLAKVEAERPDGLELTVLGDVNAEWGPRFMLSERTGGRQYRYSAPAVADLGRLLTLIPADPKAPKGAKTLKLHAEDSVKWETMRGVLVACKDAGITAVNYDGPFGQSLLGVTKVWQLEELLLGKRVREDLDLNTWTPAPAKKP